MDETIELGDAVPNPLGYRFWGIKRGRGRKGGAQRTPCPFVIPPPRRSGRSPAGPYPPGGHYDYNSLGKQGGVDWKAASGSDYLSRPLFLSRLRGTPHADFSTLLRCRRQDLIDCAVDDPSLAVAPDNCHNFH